MGIDETPGRTMSTYVKSMLGHHLTFPEMRNKDMHETNLPPIILIPPGRTLVLRTLDHRITNLVVGAVGKVIPEESCHSCNMRCSLVGIKA